MEFEYIHSPKCKGSIDIKKRKCLKCGRRWNRISFLLDPNGIRPVRIISRKSSKPTTYSSWADKLPGPGLVAGALPNWPRWARLLTGFVLIMVLSLVIWLVIRGISIFA